MDGGVERKEKRVRERKDELTESAVSFAAKKVFESVAA